MRTYPGWTFAGNSLTVNAGGRLLFNSWGTTGVVTINNLALQDGAVVRHDQYSEDLFQLASNNITVTGTAQIRAANGNITILGPIGGTGGLSTSGPYTTTLAGGDSYTGGTTVNGGSLALGATDRLSDTGPLTLAAGTFSTGGYSETVGTLNLAGSATIDFGNGHSTLRFGGAGPFVGGATLTLTNWTAGSDRLFIGNSAVLMPQQLSQITFDGSPAYQLSTGEIVKAVSAAPTVATAPSANPSPVTGTTTSLSVLGADDGGESNLVYDWSATGPAAVTFSTNTSNAAKNTTATFTKAGAYSFTVAITDAGGMRTTSTVNVTVNQTPTTVTVPPTGPTIGVSTALQFAATAADQFGAAITNPSVAWSIAPGGGSVNSTGLYTAPATANSATVAATVGSASAKSNVTVVAVSEQVAYYKVDDAGEPTLWDSSGHNNSASLNGAYSLVTGPPGNALNLTGGYAQLPNGIVSALTDFTVSAWVKPTSIDTWSRIFDFGSGTNAYMFLTTQAAGGALRFAITTGGGGAEQQVNGPAIAAGQWTHVAINLIGRTAPFRIATGARCTAR